MAYFDKVKNIHLMESIIENGVVSDLCLWIIGAVIYKIRYEKNYFQTIEISKEKDNILKLTIKQKDIKDKEKEQKTEIELKVKGDEIFKKFNVKKIYLVEDEIYNGEREQIFFLPKDIFEKRILLLKNKIDY